MSIDQEPEILEVHGGSAGVAASYSAARALADVFDRSGDRLRGMGADGLRVMRDPDLLESGLLCPGSCAAAEAAVLAVTGGPDGVLAASFGWEADAIAVRTAIDLLEAADDSVRFAIEGLDRQLVLTLGPLAAAAIAADPDVLTELPGLTEHLVDGLGGPVSAGLLSMLYGGAGRPVVTPYPAALGTDSAGIGPRPDRAPARAGRPVRPPRLPGQRHHRGTDDHR